MRDCILHPRRQKRQIRPRGNSVDAWTSFDFIVPAYLISDWHQCLKSVSLRSESVCASNFGNFRLNQRFSLEARDILEIDQNWSVSERANLIDVIREAREISRENPSISPDKAFEQALANRGLLKRFKRRCK